MTAQAPGGAPAAAVIGRRTLAVGRLRVRAFTLPVRPARKTAELTPTVPGGGARKRAELSLGLRRRAAALAGLDGPATMEMAP